MLIINHELMTWIIGALILILVLFFLSTLINFVRHKKQATLFLALNYLAYILAMIFFDIAHLSAVSNGTTTDFYYHSSMFANIFVMIGIITNILFHTKFADVKKIVQILKIIFGFLLIGWLLLPFNYEVGPTSGFQLKYITYMFMSVYGLAIYIGLTFSFFKLAKRTTESKKQLNILGIGSLIFLIYFLIIAVFGITQIFLFLFISMLCLFGSFFCYFLGIYLPKFKSKS